MEIGHEGETLVLLALAVLLRLDVLFPWIGMHGWPA